MRQKKTQRQDDCGDYNWSRQRATTGFIDACHKQTALLTCQKFVMVQCFDAGALLRISLPSTHQSLHTCAGIRQTLPLQLLSPLPCAIKALQFSYRHFFPIH